MPKDFPKPDINLLKSSTIEVFKDCLMPNGCIVAAPSHMPYYPKDAKSYLYCWPGRDSGFNLAAMLLLGHDYYEIFLNWLWERGEDFASSTKPDYLGLIYRSYFPNGLVREHQFQPDQGATLIWSIKFKKDLTKNPLSVLEGKIVSRLANSYLRVWKDKSFTIPIQDIWEEKEFASGQGNFTYSIAACSKALEIAGELIGEPTYKKCSEEMKNVMLKECNSEGQMDLPPTFGEDGLKDTTTDGSLSGLVWPFDIGFDKQKLKSTLEHIEDDLLTKHGVFRYSEDKYEGRGSRHQENEKAGTWPLLTFWLSIAWNELGDKQRAQRYFDLNFKYLNDRYIPEQIFADTRNLWYGVKPLLWSHSMGVLAAWKLGLLDKKRT